jgi:hypothetical protein
MMMMTVPALPNNNPVRAAMKRLAHRRATRRFYARMAEAAAWGGAVLLGVQIIVYTLTRLLRHEEAVLLDQTLLNTTSTL